MLISSSVYDCYNNLGTEFIKQFIDIRKDKLLFRMYKRLK